MNGTLSELLSSALLMPDTAEGIIKAIQSPQLPVKDLQTKLFPNTPAGGAYLSNFLQNTLKSNQLEINPESRTLRPLSKLKEPRELFALPKELDCPQQAARWPTECQVFEDRVKHIEYTPAEPEPYYQATGREVQPKPVGEEAGSVVFQYYPMSAVNYFSRSSVGGSRYFLPAIPVDREDEDELKFESRFESGNLAKVVKVTDTYYELYLRTDLYTNRHMQWFYFKVFNTKANVNYRFSFVNLSKGDSLYSVGMKPLMYSTKDANLNGTGWHRFGDNITYYRNDSSNGEDEQNANYTLTFNLEFQYERDEVYIAHCYPYTYTDLQDYLNDLQNHPIKSTYTKLRLLCRSLAGNNVYYVTITSPSVSDEPKRKKAVVITARVHPGETPASWMMKGFMDFLTGDSDQAKELREKFIFKLVPMLNPDGVIVGNNRCSLTGRDLNRQYRTVIRETYPPVWHTKLMIRRLMEECGIVMYCDLHAHSRKHNVFIYGCENKRYVEKRLQEQVFPLMLHKNAADKFSFENCKFRIQRSKEGTGRVVVWMMGVANSYTMEASFAGSTMGSRVDTHFTVQDFESMGRSFCETLLDFCDEEPSKEKLRTKIIERLVKEGSSADEPTNIILSDYSSDEGDTSSSSEEGRERKSNLWNNNQPSCYHGLPVPPPSPQLTKREHREKKKETGSHKKKFTLVQERSSPPPRRTLQISRTTIDPPTTLGELQDSSGADSADESISWPRNSQQGHRTGPEGRVRRARSKRMPPELIVTAAQQSSLEVKHRSMTGERTRSQSWHHSRTQPLFKSGDGDAIAASQLGLSGALRRKIWTGCACNVVHSDTALSKDSTLKKAHWSKGPVSWNPGGPPGTSDDLLKSCSQRLIALQKMSKTEAGEGDCGKIKLKKRKSWPNKKKLTRNSKTDDEQVIITDWKNLLTTKKKTNQNQKSAGVGNVPEPTTQMALLQSNDSRRPLKQLKDTPDTSNSKISQQKIQRNKFRMGGMVATAVSNYKSESGDDESDSEVEEKNCKKKKKRKLRLIKKPKRGQSAKLIPPGKAK